MTSDPNEKHWEILSPTKFEIVNLKNSELALKIPQVLCKASKINYRNIWRVE